MQSIRIGTDPAFRYLLRLGDTCLILGQRICEWSGHAPILEEDIALSNMALDLIGQARAVLTHAGAIDGRGHDEDQLAFLRNEPDYFNVTMAELPRGDFAFTSLRNALLATLLKHLWQRLQHSSDSELAAIAGKALKEARYHQQHYGDWVARLGDGTAESHRRLQAALDTLWPYTAEWFSADEVDEAAVASGLGPRWADVREDWLKDVEQLLAAANLDVPEQEIIFRSTGKVGRHSEHMGYILAEMQHLQRSYPGGAW